MRTLNIHEAKTQLSRVVDDVAAGEEVIIAKAGKPMVKMVPLTAGKQKRKLGALKGKLIVSADFDAPLPDDVLDSFER
jgi:prevent-host-death family protein